MKTIPDVVARLGRLSQADRTWILRNLSAAARARLQESMREEGGLGLPGLGSPGGGQEAAAGKEEGAGSDARVLELLDGEQAASVLAGEPAWLIATLIGLRPWPWEERMLASIAPVMRLEVNRLRLTAPRISPAMGRLLVRCLTERVSGAMLPSISAFDQLVENAGTAS